MSIPPDTYNPEMLRYLAAEAISRGPSAPMPTMNETAQLFQVRSLKKIRPNYRVLANSNIIQRRGTPRQWVVTPL